MQLQDLKPQHSWAKKKTVGRGGKRGTTAGRGTKGQKARAGHRMRPELRYIIKKLPKRRGYHFSSINTRPAVVDLAVIASKFTAGEIISPKTLVAKGLAKMVGGYLPKIKILGTAELKTKLIINDCLFSSGAREVVQAAGGTIK